MPPDMPAPKFRPVGPRITARPPVMYSQPWSPTPSTTAPAPELRTAKRSPARPRENARRARVRGDHDPERDRRHSLRQGLTRAGIIEHEGQRKIQVATTKRDHGRQAP